MEILEFGSKEKEKIILIHGLECPYQIWDKYIEYYKNNYHIIVPILPGHNPNKKEEFISFKDCANEIEDYYLYHYGNNVFAIYGISMGGILTAQIWQNKKLNIQKVIIESAPLLTYNNLINYILTNQYLILTHQAKKRNKLVMSMAINTIIPENKINEFLNVIDNISDTTLINYIKQIRKYKLPRNIDTPNTKLYYYYGTKINDLFSRPTAQYIKKYYPSSKITIFKGKGHCEKVLMYPDDMIEELNKILKR